MPATATPGGDTPTPQPTFAATPTPGPQSFAYLFSRVEYPLQLPVGGHDTVTLTLSPDVGILTVTPANGNGTAQAVPPIALPTDIQDVQDIAAAADVQGANTGPVVWQLISAPRLSLLTGPPGDPARTYHPVQFQWDVQAVAAGANVVRLTITLYETLPTGAELPQTYTTDQPIPIVAVAPTPLNTTLPPFKLPISSLGLVGALLGIGRFLWSVYQRISQMVGTAKDATDLAQKAGVGKRPPPSPDAPTIKRRP